MEYQEGYAGGLIDNRKENKDYSHLEVGKSSAPVWLARTQAQKVETLYEKRDQKQTLSCGAHAGELAKSIDSGTLHEQAFLYRARTNHPGEGMVHYEIGDLLKKKGICEYLGIEKDEKVYNAYTPTDAQIAEAKKYSGSDYVVFQDNTFTIDDIAYVSNNLKRPVILFVYWNGKEWSTSYPVVQSEGLSVSTATFHHFVTVLPNSAYVYKGQKFVIIQDSAWFGGKNIRHLSEDWINNRIYTGLYLTDFKYNESQKFRHKGYVFTRDLQIGDRGADVQVLQETLQDLGLFPVMDCTTVFGGITRQAVKDFQKKYEGSVLWTVGLKLPTGYFGKASRKKLNDLLK